jgi:hypothetical protein
MKYVQKMYLKLFHMSSSHTSNSNNWHNRTQQYNKYKTPPEYNVQNFLFILVITPTNSKDTWLFLNQVQIKYYQIYPEKLS